MASRIAGLGQTGRVLIFFGWGLVVAVGQGAMWMAVDGRPVEMLRMIVADVRVYVQRRPDGRRCGQSLSKQECDEPAHEDSLLRGSGACGVCQTTAESEPARENERASATTMYLTVANAL